MRDSSSGRRIRLRPKCSRWISIWRSTRHLGREKKFHLATFNIYKKLKRMKVSLVETTTVRVNSISGWILNIRPGNHISTYTWTRILVRLMNAPLKNCLHYREIYNVRILSRRLIWSEKNIFHVLFILFIFVYIIIIGKRLDIFAKNIFASIFSCNKRRNSAFLKLFSW